MNEKSVALDQSQDDVLTAEISDEAIELAAARDRTGNATISFCSGLETCPA